MWGQDGLSLVLFRLLEIFLLSAVVGWMAFHVAEAFFVNSLAIVELFGSEFSSSKAQGSLGILAGLARISLSWCLRIIGARNGAKHPDQYP